jgi:hypothetical protein
MFDPPPARDKILIHFLRCKKRRMSLRRWSKHPKGLLQEVLTCISTPFKASKSIIAPLPSVKPCCTSLALISIRIQYVEVSFPSFFPQPLSGPGPWFWKLVK